MTDELKSIRDYINSCVNRRSIKFTKDPTFINNYMSSLANSSNEELFFILNGYGDSLGLVTTREDIVLEYMNYDVVRNNLLKQICHSQHDNEITMKAKRDANYAKFAFNKINVCPVCLKDIYVYQLHVLSNTHGTQIHNQCKSNTEIDELCSMLDIIL